MKFKINKDLKILNPEISDLDRQNLKSSIVEKGIVNPIKVLRDGTILCGHNRYNIWTEDLKREEEDIPYDVVDMKLYDSSGRISKQIYEYVISDNMDRRNFTMKEKIEQAILLLGMEKKKQSIADKQNRKTGSDVDSTKFTKNNQEKLDEHQKILDYIIGGR